MKQKFYRVIHAILESPEMTEKLVKRYSRLLNSDQFNSEKQARGVLLKTLENRSKPNRTSLQKIVSAWKEETSDTREDIEVSMWLLLPYDHNLLTPYYDSRKS